MRCRSRLLAVLGLLTCLLAGPSLHAACTDNTFIDPLNDIAWDCIFPVSIMGVPIDFGEHPPSDDSTQAFCECPGQGITGFGFMVGFWEPARIVETVADPWCFPTLGTEIDGGDVGWGYTGGGTLERDASDLTFQHFHLYIMPIWALLDLFTDVPCITNERSVDLAMVSEVRPDWHDDLLAMQIYPETALVANPAAVFACMADAVATTAGQPIDLLYWCMGSWGTTYPMTGHITTHDYVAANAGLAGRAMYVQSRAGLLQDRAVNSCAATPVPIWVKSHWRIQQTDPVADNRCHVIGRPDILWTQRKSPVGKGDNFAWLLFRQVKCCVVVF